MRSQQRDHADDLVPDEHRDAEHGALTPRLQRLLPAVVGVGEDVGNVDGPPLEGYLADERALADLDRAAGEQIAILARAADRNAHSIGAALADVDVSGVGSAELRRVLDHRGEDQLEVDPRLAHDREHLAGGRLLLPGFGQRSDEISAVVARPRRIHP